MADSVVQSKEWLTARGQLLAKEKEATALLTSLSAERRRLPMVNIPDAQQTLFEALNGVEKSLLDLFEGRKQLIIYQHMPFSDKGLGCTGCSFFSDHIPHGAALEHLHSRDTTFVATAPADPKAIAQFVQRMDWTVSFYALKDSARDRSNHPERELWQAEDGSFKLACFWRDGDQVFLTWNTTSRGVEPVLSTYALLDMTRLGRQEEGGARFGLHSSTKG